MVTTNGKDLFSCMTEAVPNPTRGFNGDYIQAVKSFDLRDTACDSRLIKASHELYKAMENTHFIIEDYLYMVKKSEKIPNSIEFLTSEKVIAFLKDNFAPMSEIANDGRNIIDRDTAVFVGFMLAMTKSMVDAGMKDNAGSVIRT